MIVASPSWAGTTSRRRRWRPGIARGPRDLLGHLVPGFVALELLHDQVLPALRRAQLARRRATTRHARRPVHEPPATVRSEAWKGRRACRVMIGGTSSAGRAETGEAQRRTAWIGSPSSCGCTRVGFKRARGSRDGRRRPAGTAGRPARGGWSRGRGPGCGRSSRRCRPARRAGRPAPRRSGRWPRRPGRP